MHDPLLERLRNALAPRYTVERLLGRGGMGAVYLGRDTKVQLQRPVAIKIIRPELASASAVERFLHEGRTLASFSHPNIVPVHDADTADGLPYYTMDYLEGETLADRLARRRLTWLEALKLGRDVLDGLEAAHARGVVHRDIKPANIFLQPKRAVLVDFGIAKSVTMPEPATARGHIAGTYGWMAPEHQLGGEVTPQSDLYVVAMVVYDALTGRHWPGERLEDPEPQDWSRVPRRIARVLRRALQLGPERRWPDAASFRRALWRCRVWPYRWRTLALTSGGLVLGVAVGLGFRPSAPAGGARVEVEAFTEPSGMPQPGVGDSVARAVARRLARYPDLAVRGPGDPSWGWRRPATVVAGTASITGDSLRIGATTGGGDGFAVTRSGSRTQWPALADSLADDLFAGLLAGPGGGLDVSLPAAVRATTPAGRVAFVEAERLFAQALWSQAFAGYAAAAAADTACWICMWRHDEVGRWLGLVHDTADLRRIRAHLAAFPPHYQSMIRAEMVAVSARLDTLDALTRRAPEFLFGQFRRADELMHRGPLVGHARREALGPFREVVRLKPAFAPAWEHLTWLHVAEGDSADVAVAFENYARTGAPGEALTEQLRALFRVASAWRFRAPEQARPVTADIVARAAAAGMADIDAGARMLPHFDAPEGAIYFGRLLETRPAFERSGLVAQLFGHVSLGQPDAARMVGRRLLARFPDANLDLFVPELDAMLLQFDTDSADWAARWLPVRRALAERAGMRAVSDDVRRRAAWMLALASERLGVRAEAGTYRANLRGEPAPRPLAALLHAVELAAGGQYARALAVSDSLVELQAGPSDDPFFRTALHLLRAEWHAEQGEREAARRELLWHENADLFRYLIGDPEAVEVDWAFGTLARWRRARLLDAAGLGDDDACRAYRAVARLWSAGEPRYAARADTARARAVIVCRTPP